VSIHLVGGGSGIDGAITAAFVAECTQRGAAVGRNTPRVAVLGVLPSSDADGTEGLAAAVSAGGPVEIVTTVVVPGQQFETSVLSGIDGLVVAGGRTPDYADAITALVDQIRLLVADGLPYLGYSAGAMIAADRALIGGWRVGGVEVCPEAASEGLDEIELVEGLGLVDLTIDVHAVQAGTLARLIAAVESGLVAAGLAIDEDTALVVGDGALEVRGTGSVWRAIASDDEDDPSVSVATLGA
jgi:cyanophycinase